MLPPTMYKLSTIELPTLDLDSLSDPPFLVEKDERAGGIKMGFFSDKWRQSYVSEILCSTFR